MAASQGDQAETPITVFQQAFHQLYTSPVPTMALMNGPALGGGVGLLFACDFRIAASNNLFVALSEIQRGLIPALISAYLAQELPRVILKELAFFGNRITVETLMQHHCLHGVLGGNAMSSPKGKSEFIFYLF